ncbi:LOW QUALITY PROTEIN: 26S proteasome non-ATPase regulatory subunit 13 [Pangasianodon hypophthalmus]|uniref:LOW QUALITY PROTEIN: 26S proteasome non-ATPase regulatory subunit 13 n=1 Tax=Pangasianodon hypophthalmus TaxID=310915 RepID=UPI002307A68A|nr:LOW QUALITY PROTEIN: 26S proteasome non-ATPase regulatory subunit 13 [Pangasianodon hypophthalmus]
MKDVLGFLKLQQGKTPEIAAEWHTLEDLYNRKLWHQLTLRLSEFVQNPCVCKGDGLVQLYENFISDFEHSARAVSVRARRVCARESVRVIHMNVFYRLLLLLLLLFFTGGCCCCFFYRLLFFVQKLIEGSGEMLNALPGVTSVHGRFYDLSSKYYRIIGNHALYYKDALRYLGCVDVKDLPGAEQQERAFTLGLAGLLGEGVYNFGELLMHPVLESLKNTDKQWLIETLYAFNSGNVEKFQALKSAWGQQPDLAAQEAKLMQKIQLLCVMEMTFTRPANHRQLTFQEISQSTRVPVNEVELLVMKALSVGLLRGSIDEVDQRVQMTWVQPRVLDLPQIKGMKERLDFWCGDVKSMAVLVEHQAQDILT